MEASRAPFRAPQALPINAGHLARRFSGARNRAGDAQLRPAPGTYARLPAWRSRRQWLEGAVPAALEVRRAQPRGRRDYGPAGERHYPVAADTVLRIAGVLAGYADGQTGRSSRPTVDALAAAAGSCERTVQYSLQLLEALHLVVRVVEGRSYMTRRERLWAHVHGSSHRQIAAEFACTVPAALLPMIHSRARQAVDGCTPPANHPRKLVTSPREGGFSPGRAEIESRATPGTHRRSRAPAVTPATARRNRLIAGLQHRLEWLSTVSPRRLTCLARFAAHGWTPRDVIAATDAVLRARGWTVPDELANPAGYLASLLRDVDPADRLDVDAVLDEIAAARSVRDWRNELARWDDAQRNGAECPHGQPGGNLPHPVDGRKACPFCRREDPHQ